MSGDFFFTDNAAQQVIKMASEKVTQPSLRIKIDGGGCSGFQYSMDLDSQINDDDTIIENNGAKLLIDKLSLTFLRGGTLEYKKELIGSFFNIQNPNAASSCGCGTSFAI